MGAVIRPLIGPWFSPVAAPFRIPVPLPRFPSSSGAVRAQVPRIAAVSGPLRPAIALVFAVRRPARQIVRRFWPAARSAGAFARPATVAGSARSCFAVLAAVLAAVEPAGPLWLAVPTAQWPVCVRTMRPASLLAVHRATL